MRDHVRGSRGPTLLVFSYECPYTRAAYRASNPRGRGRSVPLRLSTLPSSRSIRTRSPRRRRARRRPRRGASGPCTTSSFAPAGARAGRPGRLCRRDRARRRAVPAKLGACPSRPGRGRPRERPGKRCEGTPTIFVDGLPYRGSSSGRSPAGARSCWRGERMTDVCTHLDTIQVTSLPENVPGCEDCLRIGGWWVHLRLCLTCGHVGCCDSSPNRHATAHARTSQHPIIHRSSRVRTGAGVTWTRSHSRSNSRVCGHEGAPGACARTLGADERHASPVGADRRQGAPGHDATAEPLVERPLRRRARADDAPPPLRRRRLRRLR